jgi:hypothetical protein
MERRKIKKKVHTLGKREIIFGRVSIPVSARHQSTGGYTALNWKEIANGSVSMNFYPPSLGNPLLEEVPSKSYSFKPETH